MDPTIRIPESMLPNLDNIEGSAPAVPRPAATVVLLRDGRPGVEAHMLRRAGSMAFAADHLVFPGGGIDRSDQSAVRRWSGPPPEEWATLLDTDVDDARSIVTAAVRETFEECGVLLADGPGGTPITRVGGDQWELEREAIADHRMSLAELFDRHELTLRSDLLQPWSLWVTPEFEPRRYHTWFMAARLPIGQEATPGASEAVSNEWYAIEDALRACDAGTLPMLPPQYCTLLELHGFNSVESIFTAERQVPTVRPALGRDADGGYLILPDRLVELGLRIGAQMYRDNEEQR